MAHSYRYINNLRLLKRNGGLMYCDECETLIGDINETACSAIQLYICCTCGTHCQLQFSDKASLKYKVKHRIPGYINKKYICSKCRTPLFSIIPDKVLNYGFYVECSCGEAYDTRIEHHKRLNETLIMFKEIKKAKD